METNIDDGVFLNRSRMIDGTNVVQEMQTKPHTPATGVPRSNIVEESPRAGPDQPATGHYDGITDISMCQAGQCFMLTGARDGVIKVWK